MMPNYSLNINDRPVLKVEVDRPAWLPIKTKLNVRWLRGLLARTLSVVIV